MANSDFLNAGSRLTRLVSASVKGIFRLITRPVASYRARDRIMAGQAAVILLGQLAVWLGSFYVGYALLIWPATRNLGAAFSSVGPALWTFGSPDAHGTFETAALDTAAMAGLVTVTLQIAYLPHLYAAFNRRETEIALLNPSYEASWVTALLAVLDSAALSLSLCPQSAPAVPARLCLRSGLMCFGEVARSMGIKVPAEPDPQTGISLTNAEYLDAIARLTEVDFPIEVDPEAAWPHFAGWRVNYEQAAYAIALAIDAVPALWSGPRRRPATPMLPLRPGPGQPPL